MRFVIVVGFVEQHKSKFLLLVLVLVALNYFVAECLVELNLLRVLTFLRCADLVSSLKFFALYSPFVFVTLFKDDVDNYCYGS